MTLSFLIHLPKIFIHGPRGTTRLVAAILLMAFLPPSITFAQWRTNGELDKETPAQKSVNGFGAKLMVTNDPDGLFEAWDRPPAPDYGPNISEVSIARRGDVVLAFVIFFGCAETAEGLCDSRVQYTAYLPDGTVYGQHSGRLWAGYPGPAKGSLQLSEDNLGLKIEPDDPFGTYQITADIIDNVSGTEISLSTEVTVVESAVLNSQK